MASIATLRGFFLFFTVLPVSCLETEACKDPPLPASEPIRAPAGCSPSCDSDMSEGFSSANWSHASLSLSSTWAGAVANPKKNSFSPSALRLKDARISDDSSIGELNGPRFFFRNRE
uniref:Secreted protein n=1 Tax=Rhizophora mucronata TaxID=61149 RepID=A0A2P2JSN2_RHIMU